MPEISQATLAKAGEMAQNLLKNALSQGNGGQVGGSAAADAAPPSAGSPPLVGGSAPDAAAAGAPSAVGLQSAMAGGAVAGAVAGAEAYTSLKGSPIMGGGRRRRGRGRGSRRDCNSSESTQKGGMVPGLLTAVETALVPLGLYLGQKALQSRRSSGSSSLGKSFDISRVSRRTRRRR
jgi:hypothetical protein